MSTHRKIRCSIRQSIYQHAFSQIIKAELIAASYLSLHNVCYFTQSVWLIGKANDGIVKRNVDLVRIPKLADSIYFLKLLFPQMFLNFVEVDFCRFCSCLRIAVLLV